ncbi:hypothetical protein [Falsibacillus pallidus]|uniref:hypothetical protein n=1 Tax=Falsibacillus pallidus TaxID=493781 RepID=UPI003D9870A0
MTFSIWMYVMVFVVQIVGGMLGLAIFISLYRQNRKKGLAWLVPMIILLVYSIFEGFSGSSILGAGMIVVYCLLFLASYFLLKRKKHEEEGLAR